MSLNVKYFTDSNDLEACLETLDKHIMEISYDDSPFAYRVLRGYANKDVQHPWGAIIELQSPLCELNDANILFLLMLNDRHDVQEDIKKHWGSFYRAFEDLLALN